MSAAFRSRFSLSKPKDKPAPTAAAAAGKAVVAAASPDPKESTKGLRGTRRRLSVVSDNKLIEGIATLGVHDETKTEEHRPEHVIKMYAGVSKKVRVRAVGGGGAPSRGGDDKIFSKKTSPGVGFIFHVLCIVPLARARRRPCSSPQSTTSI